MPSQDVRKFTPMSYRTSVLWGHCPALTQLLQLITPSRASGTADHVGSLDDLSFSIPSFFLLFWAAAPKGRCPVGHRGEFPDVRISIRPSVRPQISPLRPQISPFRPIISLLRPKTQPSKIQNQLSRAQNQPKKALNQPCQAQTQPFQA